MCTFILIEIIMNAGELDLIRKSWSKCGPDARKMCFIIYSGLYLLLFVNITQMDPHPSSTDTRQYQRLGQEPIKLCRALK